MNVSGVSRVQLANRLALKRSKQRRALPYPFGAGVSDPVSDPTPDPDPDPTPVPAVVQEREQLYLGYAWPRESQKFGSMKKLTDNVATILPGDENALKLGEDDDRSPSTDPRSSGGGSMNPRRVRGEGDGCESPYDGPSSNTGREGRRSVRVTWTPSSPTS